MNKDTLAYPELDILAACRESESRATELLAKLAAAVGVPPGEVFHGWAARRWRQSGELPGGEWRYFFHGWECDLKHARDGRFVRLDFGPGGGVAVSAWGTLQYIMGSATPWPEYAALKRLLARRGPPFDENSGDFVRFVEYWDALERRGCFEASDPALVELVKRLTQVGPGGIRLLVPPPEAPETAVFDYFVSHRQRITPLGHGLLDVHLAGARHS